MTDAADHAERTPASIDERAVGVESSAASLSSDSQAELVEADLLVEDVSIDGMCGVY